jgi:hypothetical protein
MSSKRRKQLITEYKSIKEREVEIITKLFESKLEISDTDTKPKGTLNIGDKVKILSGGVNSKAGDKGIVFRITDKHCEVKLDRNKALVKRAFNKIEQI